MVKLSIPCNEDTIDKTKYVYPVIEVKVVYHSIFCNGGNSSKGQNILLWR